MPPLCWIGSYLWLLSREYILEFILLLFINISIISQKISRGTMPTHTILKITKYRFLIGTLHGVNGNNLGGTTNQKFSSSFTNIHSWCVQKECISCIYLPMMVIICSRVDRTMACVKVGRRGYAHKLSSLLKICANTLNWHPSKEGTYGSVINLRGIPDTDMNRK